MNIQIRLNACAAERWIMTTRHTCALSRGVNRQMYAAPIGMNNEIMESGTPSAVLAVHERFPRVASAGTKTSAAGIQVCLFTLPIFVFLRSAGFIIAASVADLHASKISCALQYKCFFGFAGIDGGHYSTGFDI